jgi:hypothetical protein
LKTDLKDDPKSWMAPTPTSEGEVVAKKINAFAYIGSSACEAINMKEIFEIIIDVVLAPKKFDVVSNGKKSKNGKRELI